MSSKDYEYCLKVVKTRKDNDDIRYLISRYDYVLNTLQTCSRRKMGFRMGSLSEIYRLSRDVCILRFLPFSLDLFPRYSVYETKEDALHAIIDFLKYEGYQAKKIDLVGFIDNVRMVDQPIENGLKRKREWNVWTLYEEDITDLFNCRYRDSFLTGKDIAAIAEKFLENMGIYMENWDNVLQDAIDNVINEKENDTWAFRSV